MLQQQKLPLILTTTLILMAVAVLLSGQLNAIIQPETAFAQFTLEPQLKYLDQSSVATLSTFHDFRLNYVALSLVLLIFASLTCCSNCLYRRLPPKNNKNPG